MAVLYALLTFGVGGGAELRSEQLEALDNDFGRISGIGPNDQGPLASTDSTTPSSKTSR